MSCTNRLLRGWAIARRSRQVHQRAIRPDGDRCAPPSPAIRVEQVDDPELPFRLIRAAGELSTATLDRLIEAWANVAAPYALHLDLGDARIDDAVTMRRLESALDHLEQQRIEVRLVGIDPYHPVLHR